MTHATPHGLKRLRGSGAKLCLWLALAFAVCALGGAGPAMNGSAPGYVLVVHPSNASEAVSRAFVAQLFLKRATRWEDGSPAFPVDLPVAASARQAFSLAVLNRSVEAMRSYWQQRIFSGRDLPPPELATDDDVVRYVSSSPGAVGYVSSNAKIQGAKILAVR